MFDRGKWRLACLYPAMSGASRLLWVAETLRSTKGWKRSFSKIVMALVLCPCTSHLSSQYSLGEHHLCITKTPSGYMLFQDTLASSSAHSHPPHLLVKSQYWKWGGG